MEQLILISRLLIILFCTVYCFTAFSQTIQGKAKIIDGDTIHIGKNKIRLHGIDAPEINQTCSINDQIWNCGIKSSLALENLILKKEVRCEVIDIDRYKRFIAECFVKEKNINRYMVKNGWAIAYRYYSLDFIDDEESAKKKKVGIWQGVFQEPYLFRKSQSK